MSGVMILCIKFSFSQKSILMTRSNFLHYKSRRILQRRQMIIQKILARQIFIPIEMKTHSEKCFSRKFLYIVYMKTKRHTYKKEDIYKSVFLRIIVNMIFTTLNPKKEFCSPYTYTDLAMILNVNK